MKKYKPNISFHFASEEIEDKLVLNDNVAIIFINHGKEMSVDTDYFGKKGSQFNNAVDNGIICEIVIEASTDIDAEETIDLINSCLALIQGAPSYDLERLIINIRYIPGKISIEMPTYYFDCSDALYVACKMTLRAINDCVLKTAVLKFCVAQEIFYLHPMDLEPSRDNYDYQYLLSRQIKMGYAIVVCYSILEELNLHVKANSEKPSVVKGKWNDEIFQEMQGRLLSKGIDPNQKIPWLSRRTKNRPFKKQVADQELCEWSDGQEVRDFEINIIEAIFETSYIRSQIASHAISSKIAELCLYDVENTYMLIRCILRTVLFTNI